MGVKSRKKSLGNKIKNSKKQTKKLNHKQNNKLKVKSAKPKGHKLNSLKEQRLVVERLIINHRKAHNGTIVLLPLLYEIQNHFGYISYFAAHELAKQTNIPLSKIYSVISFYKMVYYEPKGKHVIRICNSPSCYLNGSLNVIKELESLLKIKSGQTTKDNKFTLEIVSCIGCCDKAPAMEIDGKVYVKLTPRKIRRIITSYA